MERLLLARHAESDFNVRGLINADPAISSPLTRRGRQQARRLGELLRDEPIELCVTSELERAKETATLAVEGSCELVTWKVFNDPNAGIFEGGTAAAFNSWLQTNGGKLAPPEGESQEEAFNRYITGFGDLLERPESLIVAIIHRLPIGLLLGAANNSGFVDVPYATPFFLTAQDVRSALDSLVLHIPEAVIY